MKENLNEKRAVDSVGRPKAETETEGKKVGKVVGKMDDAGGAKGIGGGLKALNTTEEPIIHEPAYRRTGGDKNWTPKAETGTPRQESGYQNRASGTGAGQNATNESRYQDKLTNFPKSNPATKQSEEEDAE